MTHQEIIKYCLTKFGAYLDYPFDSIYPVVKVKSPSQDQNKGRIFAQPFILHGEPKVTLNCTSAAAEYYRNIYTGAVVRGWHCPPIQQPYFNTISLDGTVPDEELIIMIDEAYKVVVAKFPKYIQKELIDVGLTDNSV